MTRSLFVSFLALFVGCSTPDATPEVTPEANPEPSRLVVYSGRSAESVEALFETFEKKTGIDLEVRYDKTPAMAERLHAEGDQTQADVFFAQDSGYLGALAKADLLRPMPKSIVEQVPSQFVDPEGFWVGTSGRMRVLVYSPERVEEADLPKSLRDLADPKWKGRLGWAPSNSSFQAHVSALRAIWGEDETRTWLTGIAANEPTEYPKNSPQVRGVSAGEIDIGWVNHYYLHKLKAADPTLAAANYSFTTAGDAGNLIMLAGVALTKQLEHNEAAETFVQFLLSEEGQRYFTEKGYEYPTVAGIAAHPDLPDVKASLADVDQTKLADVGATITMLKDVGLQ
jgi:iron(III) transport system substrate-binding protein